MNAYQALEKVFTRVITLRDILKLLEKNKVTNLQHKIEKYNIVHSIIYEILTSDLLVELLNQAEEELLNEEERTNLQCMYKIHSNVQCIPLHTLQRFNTLKIECEHKWSQAIQENKFNIVLTKFNELLTIVREIGQIRAEKHRCSLYDTFLYERGIEISTKQLSTLSQEISKLLRDLLLKIVPYQKLYCKTSDILYKSLAKNQHNLINAYLKALYINPGELEITQIFPAAKSHMEKTKHDVDDLLSTLYAVTCKSSLILHDAYPAERLQQVNLIDNYVLQQVQNNLFSRHVLQSRSFLTFLLKKMTHLPKKSNVDDLYNIFNRVTCCTIRKRADELSYTLHTILCFKLEQAMIEGDLLPQDLPNAWSEGIKHYFNVKVKGTDCLQDIQWYRGEFGYFASDLISVPISAQLVEGILSVYPQIHEELICGKLSTLIQWLYDNVYKHGTKYSITQLSNNIKNIHINTYKNYLHNKYLEYV